MSQTFKKIYCIYSIAITTIHTNGPQARYG